MTVQGADADWLCCGRLGRLRSAGLACFPLAQLSRLDLRRNRLDVKALQPRLDRLRSLDISGCSSLRVEQLERLSGRPLTALMHGHIPTLLHSHVLTT